LPEAVKRGGDKKLDGCDLCGISSVESLRGSLMLGHLVEMFVMMEIQALLPLADEPARLPMPRPSSAGSLSIPNTVPESRSISARNI